MGLLTTLLRGTRETPRDSTANAAWTSSRSAASATADTGGTIERLLAEISASNGAGLHARALALIAGAPASQRGHPELLLARAATLFAWGRFHDALTEYRRVADSNSRNDALPLQLGCAHLCTGDLDQAEAWMREAVGVNPRSLDALHGLTTVLVRARRIPQAIDCCRRSLEIDPHDLRALVWLGFCELSRGDPVAAEAQLRLALAQDPAHSAAWTNLGSSLHRQGRYQEALSAFERAHQAEQSAGGATDTYVNVAKELYVVGRLEDARGWCERSLAERPAVDGQIAYAEALAATGCLKEASDHYEFRWLIEPLLSLRHRAGRPPWSGQDLRGKTILLRVEQGFGDMIQFLRFAPHVRALGARVIIAKFSDIAGCFAGIDTVFEEEAPAYDYYVNLLSLPRVFGTDLSSIPADVPYLQVDGARVSKWKARLQPFTSLRVGVVWAGNPAHHRDRDRSIALQEFAPLFAVEGARFFSLQKDAAAADVAALAGCNELVDLGPDLEDFSDTAAAIAEFDLVICVDTAVAHLAGALGRPVWLLLQSDADWRWLRDRDDSPWYPTMRLFRQGSDRDWPEVIRRVKLALEQCVRDDPSARRPANGRDRAASNRLEPSLTEWSMPHGSDRGFSAVIETRAGIVQYFPGDGSIGKSIGWYGEYLQQQSDLLVKMIGTGATVMEVAPGVGAHSLQLADAVGVSGHLFLVEPRRQLHRLLQQNLSANRVVNATLLMRSLGGAVSVAVAPDGNARKALVKSSDWGVPVERLDEYLLDDLRLLKINEGADVAAIIEGATDTLWRLRPFVFTAIHSASDVAVLAARLKGFGYRCWRMEAPLFNPQNFNCRTADIFNGAMSLALLAIPEEIEVDIGLEACTEVS